MTELPPLLMLRAFESVSRLGTMRAAAEDLCVSHTVVSRHVSHLESWLRVKLVQSSPRGVMLTPEGELYARRIQAAFTIIADATTDLRPQIRTNLLRIWCVAGFATYWLTPRLALLQKMFPNTDILLRPFERAPGSDESKADLIVGFCREGQLPAKSILLVTIRTFPVATPSWINSNPHVQSPSDLLRLPLIHETGRNEWMDWLKATGVDLTTPLTGPLLWDAALGIDGALNGQGVALASRITAGAFLDSGRLVELFPSDVQFGVYYLIVGERHRHSPRTSRLITWLKEELCASEACLSNSTPVEAV